LEAAAICFWRGHFVKRRCAQARAVLRVTPGPSFRGRSAETGATLVAERQRARPAVRNAGAGRVCRNRPASYEAGTSPQRWAPAQFWRPKDAKRDLGRNDPPRAPSCHRAHPARLQAVPGSARPVKTDKHQLSSRGNNSPHLVLSRSAGSDTPPPARVCFDGRQRWHSLAPLPIS